MLRFVCVVVVGKLSLCFTRVVIQAPLSVRPLVSLPDEFNAAAAAAAAAPRESIFHTAVSNEIPFHLELEPRRRFFAGAKNFCKNPEALPPLLKARRAISRDHVVSVRRGTDTTYTRCNYFSTAGTILLSAGSTE